MAWLLAFDDTDAPTSGCTTALARAVAEAVGPGGHPRLVRLAPATRWKTRGNAAVVIPVALPSRRDPEDVLDAAVSIIEPALGDDPDTSTGVALFTDVPDETWYRRGVTTVLDHEVAIPAAQDAAMCTWRRGAGRGLVGALCAAAWRPRSGATWEHIAYRMPGAIGTERRVDTKTLADLHVEPDLFDCYDDEAGRPTMVPTTPCPVLYGLRGTTRRVDIRAPQIPSERVAWRTTFITNQGSDDHLLCPGRLVEGTCGMFDGTVATAPNSGPGGHVTVDIVGPDDALTLVAFEPTGRFRSIVRGLAVGDHVRACGAVHGKPGDWRLNLEKICVGARVVPIARPTCTGCGTSLKSMGTGAPLRCRRCGAKAARPDARRVMDGAWHEVAPRARRHLARPLKLGVMGRLQVAQAIEPSAT